MTSSRICASPASIDDGCAWTVVERACTVPHPPLCRGSAPVAPPVIYNLPPPDWPWQWPRRLKNVDTDVLEFDTSRRRIVDLTDAVQSFRSRHGAGRGRVCVPHAAAGVAISEPGAGSEGDRVDTLEGLRPRADRYRHEHGSPGHGADHVLPGLVAPSVTVPVQGGKPLLGTWQSIVLVDLNLDNPRRTVRLSFING